MKGITEVLLNAAGSAAGLSEREARRLDASTLRIERMHRISEARCDIASILASREFQNEAWQQTLPDAELERMMGPVEEKQIPEPAMK